jgi:hypothetical protein
MVSTFNLDILRNTGYGEFFSSSQTKKITNISALLLSISSVSLMVINEIRDVEKTQSKLQGMLESWKEESFTQQHGH